ncbi:MAG: hypothetical protein EXR79_02215 [Myxococcales bacterium]|nr:hypothetical protein [Myxococcales bacterium]
MTSASAWGVRFVGLGLALASLWPLALALDAIAIHDYLAGTLLGGLTWVAARSGVDLVDAATPPRNPSA